MIKKIRAKWQRQHDIVSNAYYTGTSGLTKEEFDSQHGAIWDMLESELIENGYREMPKPQPFFNPSPEVSLSKRMDRLEEFLGELYPEKGQ